MCIYYMDLYYKPLNFYSANESSASTDSAFDRSDASELPFSETITQLNHRALRRAISVSNAYEWFNSNLQFFSGTYNTFLNC